jgi:hypothetical protein
LHVEEHMAPSAASHGCEQLTAPEEDDATVLPTAEAPLTAVDPLASDADDADPVDPALDVLVAPPAPVPLDEGDCATSGVHAGSARPKDSPHKAMRRASLLDMRHSYHDALARSRSFSASRSAILCSSRSTAAATSPRSTFLGMCCGQFTSQRSTSNRMARSMRPR